ncbi:MAG: ATP-dependent helicase [Bacteroidetes bacterium]|nr:ATP-dependent helicase [Bacteroidota bacterium]
MPHQQYNPLFEKELSSLNPSQRKAVEKIDGPVMVIAGPGTGKTQIIAARIGNILKSDVQAGPHNILCLTYTDAGTVAMRSRLLQFIGPTAYRVNIYTFHAFCNEIIQHNLDYFGKRELEPVSELENIEIIRSMIDSLPPSHPLKRLKGEIYYDVPRLNELFRMMKEENWSPEFISAKAGDYLNDLPARDDYIYKRANSKSGIKAGDINRRKIDEQKTKMEILCSAAALFPKYNEIMVERGRYDYSDMILWVLNAFITDENFLRFYQEWYLYFLVDEYQDTSGAQNGLLQCLIDYWDKPNVFVVGDDDQCIYEFQGARVKNMTALFEKYEKDTEVIVLKENYRSVPAILHASKAVIDNNRQRLVKQEPLLRKIPGLTKELKAANPLFSGSPVKPRLLKYPNILHEELSLIEELEQLKEKNVPLNEVAVIYFKHRQAENIIELLEKKNIPYSVKKRINILDLPLVQQALNIFRYLDEERHIPHSGEHLLFEMMHYSFSGISPRDIAEISVTCRKKRLYWRECLADRKLLSTLKLESADNIFRMEDNLMNWLRDASNLTLPMLAEKIFNESGLLKHVLDSADKLWSLQVITTLFDFIKDECAKSPRITIGRFLEMIDRMRETGIALAVNKTVSEENGVVLTTAHSAKGLEFRYVFLMGCTSDKWEKSRGNTNRFTLPDTLTFEKSDEENKTESTRRLFYVAMTRAKEHLVISSAEKTNDGKPLEQSQFIAEITDKTGISSEICRLTPEKQASLTGDMLAVKKSVAIELPERNFINELLKNYSLSVTHLNKFLQCPVAFYYENILRVPAAKNESMAFGSAVHTALKNLFDRMKESQKQLFPDKSYFLDEFRKAMHDEMDSFTDIQFKNRLALGEKILPPYYDRYAGSWNKIVVAEFNIRNVEAGGIPINGKIDKIEFSGKQANVVDYKTGKPENGIKKLQPPGDKEPLGGDYWRQVVFYKILMDNQKRKEWEMISGEIDFVEPLISGENLQFEKRKVVVTREDISFVMNQIKEVYTKIMNHEFSMGCGRTSDVEKDPRKVCAWCEFVKKNLT